MKLISFYLPQYHEIPENNDAWGNGFTEWTNVRKSKPLFLGHNQPRVPLHNNYYNLLDDKVIEWQAKLAKKSGIYGFCFYHYWFNGRLVLEKPVKKLLDNKNININYCFAWANESWTKTWHGAGGDKEILRAQTYGTEQEWQKHYDYFKEYFHDERYIKENNKPMILVYRLKDIPRFNDMIQYWNKCAIKDGFDGVFVVSMNRCREHVEQSIWVNASVDFEPNRTKSEKPDESLLKLKPKDSKTLLWNRFAIRTVSYDRLNCEMIRKHHSKNHFRTAFIDYDDSPRRGWRATVMRGSSPDKFGRYLEEMIRLSRKEGNEYLFINAWNEWGEGNYLEPDEKNKYAYLNEVRRCSKL